MHQSVLKWIERLPRRGQIAVGIVWVISLMVAGIGMTWYVWYYVPVRELGIHMTFGRYLAIIVLLTLACGWIDIRRRRKGRSINPVQRTGEDARR